MKSLKYIAFALTLFLLTGCGNEPLTKALPEIAAYCGTNDIQIGMASEVSGKESINAYTLEIGGIKAIKEGYPPALVSSQCAKLLYDGLSDKQREDKNTIRVTIKSDAKSETTDYKMEDLKRVDAFVKKGEDVVKLIKKGDYDAMYTLADTNYIKRDVFNTIVRDIFEKQRTILSKTNKIQQDGFEFVEVSGIHVVNVFSHTPIDTLSVRYKLTFTDEKKPKMAGFIIK